MSFAVACGPGPALEDDLQRRRDLEPDLAVRPGGGDVLVAHALSEGADGAHDVGVAVGGDEGGARPDEALLDGDVRADALRDVAQLDAGLARVGAAVLLVGGVTLVAAARVAVEGEDGARGVVDREARLLQVLDDVGAAEVARGAHVDRDVDDGARHDVLVTVAGEDLLDERAAHGCLLVLDLVFLVRVAERRLEHGPAALLPGA